MAGDNEYAFEGYPVSEVRARYGLKPYKLEGYELNSINEISHLLKKRNYGDPEIIEQHLIYLESLSKKLNIILSTEEKEGLMNLELRQSVGEIRNLCLELAKRHGALKRQIF